MKRINTSPISGTQELLPEEQAIFDDLKMKLTRTFRRHGYVNIETPCIERTDILLAKAGGETEKQIYEVRKTGEKTSAKASQALRFDHTVPLARYVVEHESDLNFPFKVQQLGFNFRGERAQKGRFREFLQSDIDIIGRNSLPLAADVDVIATLLHALLAFDLDTPVLARISNRKILTGLLRAQGLEEQSLEIYSIIDHAEKVTPEQTKESLEELRLSKPQVKMIMDFVELHGERSEVITKLNNLDIENATFHEGVTELDQVLGVLEATGLNKQISADMKIVRGLDYYTGTVFEFCLPDYPNIGSVGGGGRYDELAKHFTDQSFPGVGGSIGLTRLFYILNDQDLFNKRPLALSEYAIIPVSDSEIEYSFKLADELRSKKHSATVIITHKKFSDKLSYAAKVAASGIVIGEDEINTGKLRVKDFATGKTRNFSFVTEDIKDPAVEPTDFWTDPAEPSTFL